MRERLSGATCSEVFAGIDGRGRDVVLKLPHANTEERDAIEALRRFAEVGGVEVYEHDTATGATLQRRVRPGSNLLGRPEPEAIEACATLILRIRGAENVGGVPLERWCARLLAEERAPYAPARTLARRLLDTTEAPTLLHGDLHHENILRYGDAWTFIDPKGIVGDPAFEITAFMRNPLDADLPAELLWNRLETFSERLGDRIQRLWAWSVVEAVLDTLWSEDDETDPTRNIARSEKLAAIGKAKGLSL